SKQQADAESENSLMENLGTTRSVGPYYVTGDAVQTVIGGAHHQYGGSAAHRLFHTRILPPGKVEGVPSDFHHRKALVLCERMG
ncbi:hypothetical protein BDR04DRAFT_989123, partial [Suillus decipiens]